MKQGAYFLLLENRHNVDHVTEFKQEATTAGLVKVAHIEYEVEEQPFGVNIIKGQLHPYLVNEGWGSQHIDFNKQPQYALQVEVIVYRKN